MFDLWSKREIKLLAALAISVLLLASTFVYYLVIDKSRQAGEDIPLMPIAEEGLLSSDGEQPGDELVSEPTEIIVDVKGAVKHPGIYRLPPDSRIFQAIEAAGGITDDADTNQLNMADFLTDGMAVAVPREGEELDDFVQMAGGTSGGSDGSSSSGTVNINRATEAELQTLSGIGPAKAAAIVQNREENGLFQSVDDLTRVSGIGEKTLENIRDLITVR